MLGSHEQSGVYICNGVLLRKAGICLVTHETCVMPSPLSREPGDRQPKGPHCSLLPSVRGAEEEQSLGSPCLYASLFSGRAVHMHVSDQPHRRVSAPAARQAQQESSRILAALSVC